MQLPTFSDILAAHELIKSYIHRTPVLTSKSINALMGCELFFKCENFQKVGAFKFRGATNAVFSLSDTEAGSGVGTHSSGNHAAALALAARIRGIKAHIVMPSNAPDVKKIAVAGYGANITFCEPTLQAREETLKKLAEEIGLTIVHPYNNFKVICGQGTAALELLDEVKNLEIMLCPVGGGGLLSGTAISTKSILPSCKVMAAEPKNADDAYRSFRDGFIHPSIHPQTIADGLLTSLGELNFAVIRQYVDEILTVSEASIIASMRMIWERMKIIIEPSSAVPLAVIMENKDKFAGLKIGIILSGGNVDLARLPFQG
ncbi:MAG: pyridoxal-phosphate dependent enzyme [Prolixibacteraceae bacterium]|jgi:threonine dehydratase|nr:pyridoxal-phosphate dependent enzyme [Prolixibacteraceae bacterium]